MPSSPRAAPNAASAKVHVDSPYDASSPIRRLTLAQRIVQIPWPLWFALAKLWLWKIATFLVLGPIYCFLISQGLQLVAPDLGVRLSRFVGVLNDYEGFHRLNFGHIVAIVICFLVWGLWIRVIESWLEGPNAFRRRRWDPEVYRKLVLIPAVILLVADMCLFYVSITQAVWGGSKFSVSGLLATAAYGAILFCVSLVSVHLRADVRDLSEGV